MNKPTLVLLTGILCGSWLSMYGYATVTTLQQSDPFPLFNTYQPHNYLQTREKCSFKHDEVDYCNMCGNYCNKVTGKVDNDSCYHSSDSCVRNIFAVFLSPFFQKASRGRDFDRQRVTLSELEGTPWNVLSMVYGPALSDLTGTPLGNAKVSLFPSVGGDANATVPESDQFVDPNHEIGFIRAPIKYRKVGLRFGAEIRPFDFECSHFLSDIGLSVYSGVVEIKQTVTTYENLGADDTSTFGKEVTALLTTESQFVCEVLPGLPCPLDPCDYDDVSIEDVYLSLWWRRAFAVNEERCPEDWAHFTITPFASVDATVPTAKEEDRKKLLGIAFGSDRHAALGCSSGFNIDFYETLEICFSGGFRHFFARDVNRFHTPTNCTQRFLYPYCTTLNVQPGNNLHFTAEMHAYNFISKLSAWIQYALVNHTEDTFKLVDPTPAQIDAFRPDDLKCRSKFQTQILNTSLYFEISPNITLGFAAQWPIMQRNSYRSTTFLGTIRAMY
jgi:hypothetical protein